MDDRIIEEARDEALRKIGRNVVNLQRMEAMLKSLAKLSGISGSASEFQDKARKWQEAVDKTSMGNLVKQVFDSLFADPKTAEAPDQIDEPWISFRLTIELAEGDYAQLRDALELIVRERNVLVHQLLADTNFGSAESCKALGELLDRQRERTIPTFQRLQGLVKLAAEARAQATDVILAEIMKDPSA